MSKIFRLVFLCASMVAFAGSAFARAQPLRVGGLTCEAAPRVGFRCVFRSNATGRHYSYAGAISRIRLDVAVTIMSEELAGASFGLAAAARSAGLRASVYLGASGKLGKQLKWAGDQGARWCLIYGPREQESGLVTVRDMLSREETEVPAAEIGSHLSYAEVGQHS